MFVCTCLIWMTMVPRDLCRWRISFCLCVFVCVYICTYIKYTSKHTDSIHKSYESRQTITYAYIHTCRHTNTYIRLRIYIYIHTHSLTYINTGMLRKKKEDHGMFEDPYKLTHTHTYIYIYTYIHTHNIHQRILFPHRNATKKERGSRNV